MLKLTTDLQKNVFKDKYSFNGEGFDEFVNRVSRGNEYIKTLILQNKFLPGGRILANIDTGTKLAISNCVTAGYVDDSMESIMKKATDLAYSFKAGSGVGIALTKLRPKGAKIGESGVSDGVTSVMRIFDAITNNVSRGNQRRGALLMGLHCDHPDIMDFINIKKSNRGNEGSIKSTNLSVLITDEFMEHYKNKESYKKDFIVKDTGEVIPHIVDTVAIMNAIVDTPQTAFEPGIIYIDNLRRTHLFGMMYSEYELFSNACSEFFGVSDTVCLLGSLNLSSFVYDGEFDAVEFMNAVDACIRYLDGCHDYGISRNGTKLQNQIAADNRGIGLGVMGLADMFVKLGYRYGDEDSIKISEAISEIMRNSAINASICLGDEKGQPEGILEAEKYCLENGIHFIKGLRNNSLLSIAPTGSLSILTNTSSGIEPVFRKEYMRKTESLGDGDMYFSVKHPLYAEISELVGNLPDYCIDTRDVLPEEKVKILSAWQKNVDLSISNTTNFKSDATVEDIKRVYELGYEYKVNGLTVYVDDSAIEGVLNDIKEDDVKCPDCGEELSHDGGCISCVYCGYSKC